MIWYDLSSSRVEDTLVYTLTPAASGMCQFTRLIHVNPMSFKSLRIMSCQFFRGLPGFLFQFKAWFGILQSSIVVTCPSHLSLLSLIISSSFAVRVLFLTAN